MQTTIICPHCKEEIELTAALTHQIEGRLLGDQKRKHDEELRVLQKKLETAQGAELEIRKEKNKLEEERRTFELEKQRQLDKEREVIRQKTAEEILESQRLKDKEKDKVIDDLKKALEDAQRKATQGSQQLQGEVQELDLEQMLKREFPEDAIEPIAKGVLGADVRQTVHSTRGNACGVILWESKRTKAWSDGWIGKLKEDLRNDKANVPVIVSEVVPEDMNKIGIGEKNGVYICRPSLAYALALLLRRGLLYGDRLKMVAENKQTKAEELYTFVTSHEFTQNVEAMIEIYVEMKNQVQKERMAFEKSWKLREAQVQRLLSGVAGMYGNMQGIAGTALPTIKNLELDGSKDD